MSVEVDHRTQLLSPPPEEILSLQWGSCSRISTNLTPAISTASNITQAGIINKRKRAPTTPVKKSVCSTKDGSTPNPKPRKQRHATPIPPYEPPRDIFTPPREIFLPPTKTKCPPKRKGAPGRQTKASAKGKDFRVNTNVKQEMPDDIDLLAPMPPPSPTDDPLLLSGPTKSKSVWESQSFRDADVAPLTLFDSGWSDSDDEVPNQGNDELEGEGEFTGKWRMMKVRTKQDPPSSATRMRQELWGRPISPFPIKKFALIDEEEEEVRTPFSLAIQDRGDLLASDDSQDDDSDASGDPGLVKVTSADPRAAARAVAILKQHDYDCYTKLTKKRRASQSAVVDLVRESRRKGVTSAGIMKTTDPRRHRSTMSAVGDRVIPGPVITLPELLQEVEDEITCLGNRSASTRTSFGDQDPFKTPISVKFVNKGSISTIPERYPAGPREWTREDWKVLDACFTDQRINPGNSYPTLTPVNAVALQDVVVRFINTVGGQPLVDTFGESWSRDNLLERTRALLKKQRSGSVAPPTTPISAFSFASPLNFATSSKTSKMTSSQEQPCLPLPPPSVLEKPRGPVSTPVRPLVPRAPHPKDLVHLNHVMLRPSNIPRAKQIPKRLVALMPVPHTLGTAGGVTRPSRSSGSSVKDLVREFEEIEKSADQRFSGIVGKTRMLRQGKLDSRPIWKP